MTDAKPPDEPGTRPSEQVGMLQRMIVDYWSEEFCSLYGGALPDDYCCLDVETTGFSRDSDFITEIGHCLVRNRQPVDRFSVVLNWYMLPRRVPAEHITYRLNLLTKRMAEHGRTNHMTPERMRREGIEPIKALTFYWDFIELCRQNKLLFVSHNGYQFDEELLEIMFDAFLKKPGFRFGANEMFDTGAIEKATRSNADGVLPIPGETMRDYFRRIVRRPMKGKWAMDPHCIERYSLKQANDNEHEHTAKYDTLLNHRLFESFRGLCQGRVPAVPAPTRQKAAAQPRSPGQQRRIIR